jgi:hypothetical protein
VTDDQLACLSDLSGLAELDLIGAKVTGTGLAHLKGLKRLEALFLERSEADDDGPEGVTHGRPRQGQAVVRPLQAPAAPAGGPRPLPVL